MDTKELIKEAERWASKLRMYARRPEDLRAPDLLEQLCDALQLEHARHLDVLRDRDSLSKAFARRTSLRPIAEAPLDGTWVQIHWNKEQYPRLRSVRWAIARYVPDCFVWVDERQEPLLEPTEYLPLPDVQP